MYKYVPILNWKRGERTALLHTTSRADVVPLLVLGADRFVGRAETPTRAATSRETYFAETLDKCWGKAPIYLDASRLSPNPNGLHPLSDIVFASISLGQNIIPSTKLGAPQPYQNAIMLSHQMTGSGFALRVDLQEFSSAHSWVSSMPLPMQNVDLIVDLGSNVQLNSFAVNALDPYFASLFGGAQWRSVTVAGSSMPENFTGLAAGQYQIARIEWALWRRLSNLKLGYRLDYGDYATVPTILPPEGIAWGFPINVKYTTSDHFYVCRGVRTVGASSVDMDQQLIGHAQQIVAYPNRGPLPCWADSTIDNIAAQNEGPGGLERWVEIGVSRHIERVRTDLP
jgi:hypothetical protein